MSPNSAALHTILVEEAYGEAASRIFKTLHNQGRCSHTSLPSKTGLPLASLRNGLTTLLQHGLIFWYSNGKSTVYEPNTSAAHEILRAGKYIQIAEQRCGEIGGRVVSFLLESGHARVEEVIQACRQEVGETTHESMTSPAASSRTFATKILKNSVRTPLPDPITSKEVYHALIDLLSTGHLHRAHESFFHTQADNHYEAQKVVESDAGRNNSKCSKKEQAEALENEIQAELDTWRYGTARERNDLELLRNMKKRPLEEDDEDDVRSSKRLKVNGVSSQAAAQQASAPEEATLLHDGRLKSDLVISVNGAKFELAARNDCLGSLVESRVGKVTANIYRIILAKVERRLLECCLEKDKDENARKLFYTTCTITTREIAVLIPQHEDLRSSIGIVAEHKIDEEVIEHPKKKRRKAIADSTDEGTDDEAAAASRIQTRETPKEEGDVMVNGIDTNGASNEAESPNSILENEDVEPGRIRSRPQKLEPRIVEIRSHLLLLTHHPMKLLEPAEHSLHMIEDWVIKFPDLVERLQRQEIAETISAKYGTKYMRLVNILIEHGKLDDKTLSALSMIREKEVRPMLTTMQQAGLLELQEVPRDNARLASRTTFLFFFDQDRCRRNLLEDCYKTMTHLLQRMRAERQTIHATHDRQDRGAELTKDEKQALEQWQGIEEMLWGQVIRIDDTVALLRDY